MPCIGLCSLWFHCTLKYFPKASLSKETIAFFSHMHLTALACSRLVAMCTTQGNKLMRGDLCKGESERKKEETDSFLLHSTPFCHVIIVCCFISQCCFMTQPWNPSALTRWPKPPLNMLYIALVPRWQQGLTGTRTFFSFAWHGCGFFFHCSKQVNICALTCSHCFPKLLFSNWKPLSLVTLKTGSLSDELR